MSELSQAEKNEISHRGRAARLLAAHLGAGEAAPRPMIRTKSGAAALSIASNSLLIAIKLAAGAITGSIAIVTEAVHSLIDLVASVVAFVSVRKADEPADAEHPYGHEKVESLAATIEGMLILVGAGIIVYEATHRLVVGAEVEALGVGIAVMGFSVLANLVVSTVLSRQAKAHESPALEGDAAHLRTDALTSAGVLVGLAPGPGHRRSSPSTRSRRCSSPRRSSSPGSGSSAAPPACSSTKRCPTRRWTGSRRRSPPPAPPEVAGYHKLRARRAGSRRYIDLHVQYRSGTSLERAHELAHAMRAAIEADIPGAEVLIHAEPETSLRDPERARGPVPGRLTEPAIAYGGGALGRGQQIDRGGEADGADGDRVAGVAADREEDRGDRADDDDGDPGSSGQGHGPVFWPRCPTVQTSEAVSGRRRRAARSPT